MSAIRCMTGMVCALLLQLPNHARAETCLLPAAQYERTVESVSEAESWTRSANGLIGANTLYHYDDDAFWRNPAVADSLGTMHMTSLRFPGGENADNYDWETNKLERPGWPGEARSVEELKQRTDYLEFLEHARRAGVQDIFLVVNVDGAFRAGGDLESNLLRYANKAARWVAAVKKSGYRVKYWEIGNEPYLGIGYPLKASEYARAVKVYARAMRAADPTILIGAAGPSGMQGVGFADRMESANLRELRKSAGYGTKACAGFDSGRCGTNAAAEDEDRDGKEKWWDTLISEAGDSFDFAVVHRYDYAKFGGAGFAATRKIRRLKEHLQQATGRVIPLALTEWNTPNEKKHRPLTEMEQLIDIAIQFGNNAVGGVDFAHYWPMRTPSGAHKPLLDEHGRLTEVGKLFGLFSEVMAGASVSESSVAQQVYVFRAKRTGGEGYVLVNAGLSAIKLKLDNGYGNVSLREVHVNAKAGGAHLRRLRARADGAVLPSVDCDENVREQFVVGLPARSISIVQVVH